MMGQQVYVKSKLKFIIECRRREIDDEISPIVLCIRLESD